MSQKKILVTGATGLVGSHILVELSQMEDLTVYAAKRKSSNVSSVAKLFEHYQIASFYEKINWVDFDLNHPELNIEVDEIIHSAAVVSFDKNEYQLMTKVNLEGTKKLLKLAKDKNVKKFGFVSSIASLGRTKNSNHYSESSPWSESTSNSYYSITKYQSEQLVIEANSETMSTYIINPGVILGPCDWNNSSGTIFKSAIKGLKFYTKGINGFVDVRDVARAMILVMERGKPQEKHIVVGQNISYKDVFTRIAKQTNSSVPSIYAPKLLTDIGWRLSLLKAKLKNEKPILTKESANTSHGINYYDNKKLIENYQFEYHSIDDAISNSVAFLKNNRFCI